MTKVCQITGKKPLKGRKYSLRGIAKKKKGIGLKITGIKKRRFLPNLIKKRLWLEDEKRFITLKLTPSALRTINKKGLKTVLKKSKKSA